MNRALSYIIRFIMYLVAAFAGVWVSNILLDIDANPFVNSLPYIVALGMLIFTIKGEM